MLLHAPSEGLCRQYGKCLVAGLALLEAAWPQPGAGQGQQQQQQERGECADGGDGTCAPVAAHHASACAVVPGGGALDALLAAALQRHIDQVQHGPTTPTTTTTGAWLARLDALLPPCRAPATSQHLPPPPTPATQHPPPTAAASRHHLLPGLRVLQAMASAVPHALAHTAAGQGAGGAAREAAAGPPPTPPPMPLLPLAPVQPTTAPPSHTEPQLQAGAPSGTDQGQGACEAGTGTTRVTALDARRDTLLLVRHTCWLAPLHCARSATQQQ